MKLFLLLLTFKISVSASIPPIASLVKAVVNGNIEVVSITSVYENPHTYEPKPSDILKVEKSTIFFTNGLGVDGWAIRIGGKKLYAIGDTLKKKFSIKNPHIWLDPTLAKEAVKLIAQVLSRQSPSMQELFEKRAEKLSQMLDSLISMYRVSQKDENIKAITYHPAWNALLEAIGIKVAECVVPHPGREPSLKRVKEVIEKGKKEKVTLVIIETGFPSNIPEQIADEIGAKKVELNPVVSGDYIEEMEKILRKLKKAFNHGTNN